MTYHSASQRSMQLVVVTILSLLLCMCSANNEYTPDIAKINEGAKLAEEAFLSGSTLRVLSVMTDEAKEQYELMIPDIEDKLLEIGERIKSRKLVEVGNLYAEYAYDVDGTTYTIAFAKEEDDGPWKLVRF